MAKRTPGRYTHCVDCGKPASKKAPLSTRGLHRVCAERRMMKSAGQMQAKSGPYYDQWERGMADFARRVLAG